MTDTDKKTVDAHVRSTRAIASYSVVTSDCVIGQVADFMIDGRTWMIREIAVDCGHWYSGNKMMISTGKVSRISYDDGAIYVDSTKNALRKTAVSAGS
ncbi:MAG: PRC-barrel domain-containing protein [Chthoniobacterales bacterium]